ncbi:integrase catalytic domain-containing protein [Trichonephila clavipes]|uniref:Integrase catalytic domain-containing protein n=1 Tax=Trichonephila clavipes TaxID=2585209 RepID=A0A8X6VET4_TRICX|nr:integrase catalytic domain-containing protein [Trichonephila clavipes]
MIPLLTKANVSLNRSYTKRDVLSQIARIYDPFGLLGPVISKAKIFMQQLWLLKLDWFEILPPDILQQWEDFIKTQTGLEKIKIPSNQMFSKDQCHQCSASRLCTCFL